ncbi:hypothetical protein DM01DRAFT_1377999 [Hesseltinella vesiculosa]|uniref:Cas12f1-like TNB domain-containing protein n=1 Tax=Hesseltinella vesiculosa TaxID=101127 RepID=A0A1X2G5P2_9FUNG|nr:hypothetical protein DM01DRAFT_1377999 [Hesseltinella vesiculosa]
MGGLQAVVDFNRRVLICSHLFILDYFNSRLTNGLDIPLVFLDYRFVNGVFQLVIGRSWSNNSLFTEEVRQHIEESFATFLIQHPNVHCPLVPSAVRGKRPIGFSKILTSTARTYASSMVNHVVEGFDQAYIGYLQARLARSIPELNRFQVGALADFVFDTCAQNQDFEPVWPTINVEDSIDHAMVDAKVDTALNELIDETWDRWTQLAIRIEQEGPLPQQDADEDNQDDESDNLSVSTATAMSIDTISTLGISRLDVATGPYTLPPLADPSLSTDNAIRSQAPPSVSITTTTITRYPHLFIKILFDVLCSLERLNEDQHTAPAPQTSVHWNWTHHQLSGMHDWSYLNHHQRSKLVRGISKSINNNTPVDIERLPRVFSQQSRQQVTTLVAETQRAIAAGTFSSEAYLVSPKVRLFSVLPTPSLTRKFIQVSHDSLGEIMRHFGLEHYVVPQAIRPVAGQVHDNFKILNLKRIHSGRGIFLNQLYTDGYSVCVPFKKMSGASSDQPLRLTDISPVAMQQMDVWGKDPGVTDIFVASNSSDPRAYLSPADLPGEPLLATPPNPRHQIRRFSSAEYYVKAGYRKTVANIKAWKQQHGITEIESSFGSPKTTVRQNITAYITEKLRHLDRLLLFYGQDIQQLRFLNYRGAQLVNHDLVKIFVDGGRKYGSHASNYNSHDTYMSRLNEDGSFKSRRRQHAHPSPPQSSETRNGKWRPLPFQPSTQIPLLCIGDGRFGRRRFNKKPLGLANRFKKVVRLAQRQFPILVVDADEAFSSKVCSKCGKKTLTNVTVDGGESKLHAVQCCETCSTVWQRDCNASRNIHALSHFAALGVKPLVFTPRDQDQADPSTTSPPDAQPNQPTPT